MLPSCACLQLIVRLDVLGGQFCQQDMRDHRR